MAGMRYCLYDDVIMEEYCDYINNVDRTGNAPKRGENGRFYGFHPSFIVDIPPVFRDTEERPTHSHNMQRSREMLPAI